MVQVSLRSRSRADAGPVATKIRLRGTSSALVLLACAVPWFAEPAARAQTATALPVSAASDSIGEVIVTAQRRSESQSKVPISVSAFDGAALADHAITKENELQSLVPGLTMITTNSSNEFDYAIRGQTLQAYSGSAPGVLPYVNDVPMSPHGESALDLYDMASVQVLKGPQGTLFGRNNTGGAILYGTAQPEDAYGGFVDVSGGSYDARSVKGAVNIPLVPGKFDVRVAGDYDAETGYLKNLTNNTTLGDVDNKSIRVTAKISPTDKLTSTFMYQYNNAGGTEGNPQIYSSYVAGQTNNGYALSATSYYLTGGLQPIYAALAKQNPYNEYLYYTAKHSSHGETLENTTTYDITPNLQIKNIAGYVEADSVVGDQLAASPFVVLDDIDGNHCCDGLHYIQDNWSEELQLLGQTSDQTLKYIVGAFDAFSGEVNQWPLDFGGYNFQYHFATADHSKALFSQETLDMSSWTGIPGLSVTGGVRYTWENLDIHQLAGGAQTQPGYPLQQHTFETAPSWQFGVQDQVTQELLVYAVTRGSWRSGGFNDGNPTGNQNLFKKETTEDVEAGAKFTGSLFGRPVRASIAGYDQRNQNYQTTLYTLVDGNPGTVTVNAAHAEVRGSEFSLETSATSWLRLGGSGSYNFAFFKDPNVSGNGFTGVLTNFANTPRWTTSLFATVYLPTPDQWGPMSLRADSYTTSDVPFSNFAHSVLPGTILPGYTTVNLRYDWQEIFGSKASFSLYGKNVLDRTYWLGGFPVGVITGTNIAIPAQPATVGAELSYKF